MLLGGKKPDSTSGWPSPAARCRDAGCLRVLAEHGGVDVLARYELEVHDARGVVGRRGRCCTSRAVGSADAARVLLAAGARADETCAGGWTALHFARRATCRRASLWTCWWRAVPRDGATTDATEAAPPCTASMIAAARGNADALRLHAGGGGDEEQDVGDEARAMRCALERGHMSLRARADRARGRRASRLRRR